ncbi:MAG: AtpZ/AtpI family protein [Sulfurovum sp.]|nr:AtpZ/AtpI family protein [Sulfurovaceae bacterium]
MREEEEPKFKKVADAANGLSLGISMVVAVVLGVAIGIGMRELFDIEWLLWLGVFWGISGAILNVYKAYEKQKRVFDDLAKEERYLYNKNLEDKNVKE